MMYGGTYLNIDEFKTMFDHRLYDRIRQNLRCKSNFPEVYDKLESRALNRRKCNGSGHDDGAGNVWLAQVICHLVYSVYQDNGNYYNNGSASTVATTTAAAVVAATTHIVVASTEMVMTATTNGNKLLVTEARVDRLDCGGTWTTLDCRRVAGALACTDSLSKATDADVRLYLPARLSAHFDGQPAVSVGLPEMARGNAVTVVRCDGDGGGVHDHDGVNQVTCSIHGEQWPPATVAIDDDDDPRRSYNWKYLFVFVFIASGGVGNILVCLAICLDRQLQNVTNYFLLSLAIADLLVCLFVIPLPTVHFRLQNIVAMYDISFNANIARRRYQNIV